MKFVLIDRIEELTPGKSIRTTKALTLSEEYLADHFPTFPVMPGVLMLEALTQSAAWLVRATQDFRYSLIVLESAKNVTYKNFVQPGRCLTLEVVARSIEENVSSFSGIGRCSNSEMVKARITLKHLNLADGNPALAGLDEQLIESARARFRLIGGAKVIADSIPDAIITET